MSASEHTTPNPGWEETMLDELVKSRVLLQLYQEAEDDGYIHRCSVCGSFRIEVNRGTRLTWGNKEELYTEYSCDSCGNRW